VWSGEAGASPDHQVDVRRDVAAPDVGVPDARPDGKRLEAWLPDAGPGPDAMLSDGGSFPSGQFGCMGTANGLPLLGQVGNIAVYSGCGGDYLLVWGGNVGRLSATDVAAIKQAHDRALMAIPGVWGNGVGLCCAASTNGACLSVWVSANTITVWDLAKELNVVFANETECFGVVAQVPSQPGPRCQGGDQCHSIPICGGIVGNPLCCNAPPYDGGAVREPTLEKTSPHYWLELPQSPNECHYDGECVLNGCGNHCNAYTAAQIAATCSCYPELAKSFCGCVGGECVWYEQK
jgi:hypothetical protein